jgi:sulfate transport system ATP-binding protein
LSAPAPIEGGNTGRGAAAAAAQTTGATVSERANLGWTVRYTLRFDDDVEVEYSVTRQEADGPLGLDVGQRIFLYVRPEAMMGFEPEDVDSAPVV